MSKLDNVTFWAIFKDSARVLNWLSTVKVLTEAFLQVIFFECIVIWQSFFFFQTCLGNAFWISVLTVAARLLERTNLVAWNLELRLARLRIPSAYGQSRWCQVKTPSIPMTITITTRSDLLMSSGKTKISKTNFSFQILSCLLLKNKNESYLM